MTSLTISECFTSLQGESRSSGFRTFFIRLSGCPLRCTYCDTRYAFKTGEAVSISQLVKLATDSKADYITVTGGEPLAQAGSHELMSRFCDLGYQVSLETSGYLDISKVDPRVHRVVDIKTPYSGEVDKNLWQNMSLLTRNDSVKFVLGNKEDYRWAKAVIEKEGLVSRCEILLSPVEGELSATELAKWMLDDKSKARLQIQLHKILWGTTRGV